MNNVIAHADWMAEGERRFGTEYKDWKFVCPTCGDIADARDFRQALDAIDSSEPSSKYVGQACIGRVLGALKGPMEEWKGRGCDWVAFGLLRGPVLVAMPDDRQIPVFRFAPEEPAQ